VLIPKRSFERIAEKIVRGMYYLNGEHFIEPPYKVNFFPLDSAGNAVLIPMLERGERFAREPGIVIRRIKASDDHFRSIFEIELWKQLKLFADVSRSQQ